MFERMDRPLYGRMPDCSFDNQDRHVFDEMIVGLFTWITESYIG